MSSLAIAESIIDLINTYVIAQQPILKDICCAENGVYLQSTEAFHAGEYVAIRDLSSDANNIEIRYISCVTVQDETPVLLFDENVTCHYAKETTEIFKVYNGLPVKNVFIGDPGVVGEYPCVIVEVNDIEREPFTLESIQETYSCTIITKISGLDPNNSYKACLSFTDACVRALEKRLFPLISPYFETTLAHNVGKSENVIKTTETLCRANQIVLEDSYGNRRINAIESHESNNVYVLKFATGIDLSEGDKVLISLVNTFDTRVGEHVSYNSQKDGDLILRESQIDYRTKLLRRRGING